MNAHITIVALALFVGLGVSTNLSVASANEPPPLRLDIVWTSSVQEEARSKLWIRDIIVTPDNQLVALSMDDHKATRLIDIDLNEKGTSKTRELPINPRKAGTPNQQSLRLALTSTDRLFTAGRERKSHIGDRLLFDPWPVDVFVAELTNDGKVISQTTFGSAGPEILQQMQALPSGDLILAGFSKSPLQNERTSWIMRVSTGSQAGDTPRTAWQQEVGNGKGQVISVVDENKIMMAAIETRKDIATDGQLASFEESIVVRQLSPEGSIADEVVVRTSSIGGPGLFLWHLAIVADRRSTYVASSWLDGSKKTPTEAVRVANSDIAWRKQIDANERSCNPSIAVMGNGDLLAACSREKGVELIRFDKATGASWRQRFTAPECQMDTYGRRILLERWGDNGIVIAAVRGESQGRPNGCSWAALIRDVVK